MARDQVFISYSHEDRAWLERLQTHLKPYVRKNTITVWTDTEIDPGAEWLQHIEKALDAAKVAVLLVSPHFLASDFIAERELPRLLKASQSGGLTILWVALSSSAYKETEIFRYQAAINPGAPLDSLPEAEQNQAFVTICEKIKRALEQPDTEEPSSGKGPEAEAVHDPLLGLPSLPERDLPAKPFRHLHHFGRKEAELFFGRGQPIRDLYEQVTDPEAAPILLLYARSGVGKSSLLEAGLVPRLARMRQVRSLRRDPALALAGTLRKALYLDRDQPEDTPFTLLEAWRELEEHAGKPLVIILDQLEEAFTNPQRVDESHAQHGGEERPPTGDQELADLLEHLAIIFRNPATRPKGKLILSLRKEWLPELMAQFEEADLPFSRFFLKRLDRAGIIEAVRGVAEAPRLRRHYRLTLEDGLAEIIADHLLEDQESPLAPTLQVLLTKMWDEVQQADTSEPHFDVALYQRLKKKGILLEDFLEEQLAALRAWNEDVMDSGLALDVLAYHTTALGTGGQQTKTELAAQYAHQEALLPELLQQCKDLYLLVDPSKDQRQQGQERVTGLAHDTLAPLILRMFRVSDRPGQRARRILASRAEDWSEGREGPVLDEADLATVERGAPGMRGWTQDERRLVKASWDERARRRRRSLMVRGSLVAAVVAIIALAGVAWVLRGQAKDEAARAQVEAKKARASTEFVVNMFEQANPENARGLEITAKELLEEGAVRIHSDLANDALVQAELFNVVGRVYLALGEYDKADSSLRQSDTRLRSVYAGQEHPDLARSRNDLGVLYREKEDPLAESFLQEALAMRRRLYSGQHADVAESLYNLAVLYTDRADYDRADSLLRLALSMRRSLPDADSTDVADVLTELGNLSYHKTDLDAAESYFQQALAIQRAVLGTMHPDVATSLHNVATVTLVRGLYDDPLFFKDADSLFQQALKMRRDLYGQDHVSIASTLRALAEVLENEGKIEEAEQSYGEALAMTRRLFGDDHSLVAAALSNMATFFANIGDPAQARPLYQEALAIYRVQLGDDHPDAARTTFSLGRALEDMGEDAGAEQHFQDAIEVLREKAPQSINTAEGLYYLGSFYLERGQPARARPWLDEAETLSLELLGEDDYLTIDIRAALARVDSLAQ